LADVLGLLGLTAAAFLAELVVVEPV